MSKKLVKAAFASFVLATAMGGMKMYYAENLSESNLLLAENVEALSQGESGAKCPNGCKDIGWGFDKILECDCNYDHFSCCNNWGC